MNNRVLKQTGNPATAASAYKFDAANQLIETHQTTLAGVLQVAYLYDNAGNQTQKCSGGTVTRTSNSACAGSTVQTYAYNSFNKLSQYNGAISGSYLYDHQGRRIQRIEGGNAFNYIYDGKNIYSEYLTSSWTSPNMAYVQAGTDHPLARLTGNIGDPSATAAYYHQDGLGSVLATTNAAKAVTASQRFGAFGATIAQTGTIAQYGYTGREPDASGLTYYRARYYDAGQARFTQRDPIGLSGGINRYAYVGNNPLSFNDPDGLLANQISNAWTAGTNYFNTNPGAAFGGGLVVGGGASYGVAYGLASLTAACPLCGAAAGIGLLGYTGYQLVSDNFAGAKNIGDSFQAVANGTANSSQAFTVGSTLGGVIGGYAGGSTATSSRSIDVFRVVDDTELADINSTGIFRSATGQFEGKQFVDNLQDAQRLQQRFSDFFGGNQTIVQGTAPKSVIDNANRTSFSDIPNGSAITILPKNLPSVKPICIVSCN